MRYDTDAVHRHEYRRQDYEGVDNYEGTGSTAGYGDYHGAGLGQLPIPPQIVAQIQSLFGQLVVVDDTGMQRVSQPEYATSALDQLELQVTANALDELIEGQAGLPTSYPNVPWVQNRVNQGYVVMVNPASISTGKLLVRMTKQPAVIAASAGQELGPASYVIVQGPPATIEAAHQIRHGVVAPPQVPPGQPPVVVPPAPPYDFPPGTPPGPHGQPPGTPPTTPPGWWDQNKGWAIPAAAVGGGGLLLLYVISRDRGPYHDNRRRRQRR
jgi:hypothetical protein